jgi:hypothetical protein
MAAARRKCEGVITVGRSCCSALIRTDAVKALRFDRMNRIYRMAKRDWRQK